MPRVVALIDYETVAVFKLEKVFESGDGFKNSSDKLAVLFRHFGKVFEVLVEGPSKKTPEDLCGRTGTNKMCVWKDSVHKSGDYVKVKVVDCTQATLLCQLN